LGPCCWAALYLRIDGVGGEPWSGADWEFSGECTAGFREHRESMIEIAQMYLLCVVVAMTAYARTLAAYREGD
jgi:hypothetical protein